MKTIGLSLHQQHLSLELATYLEIVLENFLQNLLNTSLIQNLKNLNLK